MKGAVESFELRVESPAVADRTLHLNLTPRHTLVAVNSDGDSAASTVRTDRKKADAPLLLSPAGGGNVHTSHLTELESSKLRVEAQGRMEAEIITAARPVVVKEILELLGDDVPSPTQHAKYLDSLPFSDLCARRDQLLQEQLPIQLGLGAYMLKGGGEL